jgi:hypothetical protein
MWFFIFFSWFLEIQIPNTNIETMVANIFENI